MAVPLPVDQIWEVNLGRGIITLGPIWAEEGSIHLLTGVENRVKEVIDGRVVTSSPELGGLVTAIDRAECNETEGVEVLVAVKGDTLSELLVLNGLNFGIISRLTLGNNPHTKIAGIAWLEGSRSIIIVRTTYSEYSNSVAHVYETTESARVTTFNLEGRQVGASAECGYGSIERWRDEENNSEGYVILGTRRIITISSGFRSEFNRFMLTTLNSAGDIQNAVVVYSGGGGDEENSQAFLGGKTIAPLPDDGFAMFEAFAPAGFPPVTGHVYAYRAETLEQIALNAEIGRVPHSLAYIPPEGSAEGLPFLLCAFERGEIRLFDLSNFRFNPQEYIWEPSSNHLNTGDFDQDNQFELLGLSGGLLTCARIQQLDVEFDPIVLPPNQFSLSSFPNPFNSSTTISYTLPQSGWTTMDVMDVSGRLVERLSGGWKAAGKYREQFNASNLPDGTFLLLLDQGSTVVTRTIVNLK
jgi:hypothetical protein